MIAERKLLGTLERKKDQVVATDEGSFFVEVRAFLLWALKDEALERLMLAMMAPPDEVELFRQSIPGLIVDARNVAHWLRAEAPAARAQIGNDAHWAEFDRLVDLVQEPGERSEQELAEITDVVFTTLRAVRDAVGRSHVAANDDERIAAWHSAVELTNAYDHRVRERDLAMESSSGVALARLVAMCRAIAMPPEGTPHWTDFAPAETEGRFSPKSLLVGLRDRFPEWVVFGRRAFARFYDGLATAVEGDLPLRYALSRFKQRSMSFDRKRLRQMAIDDGDDALTMELARYLFDHGHTVQVSSGGPGFGFRAEAPGGSKDVSVRSVLLTKAEDRALLYDVVRELQIELAPTESTSPLRRGLLVVFTCGGPSYELPPSLTSGNLTIELESIDLTPEGVLGRELSSVSVGELSDAGSGAMTAV